MDLPVEIGLSARGPAVRDLDFSIVTAPSHGTLEFAGAVNGVPSRYRYRPSTGFIGEDSFEFAAVANGKASHPATVRLRVVPLCALKRLSENGFFGSVLSAVEDARDPARLLVPGGGFAQNTAEPPAQGNTDDPGYDQRVIARWDTVPFATLREDLFAGVVAFHMSGIDRVEFSLDGGPWTTVRDASLNPYTCVVEYWAVLHPAGMRDGPSEVRAVAYPKHGLPRVLQGPVSERYIDSGGIQRVRVSDNASLFLFFNHFGSLQTAIRHVSPFGDDLSGDGSELKPFATIERAIGSVRYSENGGGDKIAGAEIVLAEGVYSFNFPGFQAELSSNGDSLRRYVTIRSEDGARAENVIIGKGFRGVYCANLHLKDLRVEYGHCLDVPSCNPLAGKGGILWLDNVGVQGMGMKVPQLLNVEWSAAYFTDIELTESQTGIQSVALARNVIVTDAGEDSFKFADVIINAKVRNITNARTGYHPDVWQYFGPIETMGNLIVYGLDAQQVVAQGIGAPACDGCAFVDVYINNHQVDPEGVLQNLQFGGLHKHSYIKNSCLIGPNNFRSEMGFVADDVVVEHSFFARASGQQNGLHPQVTYRDMAASCRAALGPWINDLGPSPQRVAKPALAPPPGSYGRPVTVSFTTATDGGEIRYTLDGTTPGIASTLYTEPLTLTAKTRLKIRAFKYGMLHSEVEEAYYTFQAE